MRFALLLLILLLLVLFPLSARAAAPIKASSLLPSNGPHLLGDSDCSGTVDARDALVDVRKVAGLTAGNSCDPLGDVDCDSSVSIVDAINELRYAAGVSANAASAACPAISVPSMRILLLDKFGDGLVASSAGDITCGDGCTLLPLALPDGADLSLSAMAAPGSHFDHWFGCDSSSGTDCSATMTGDKTVLATFAIDEASVPTTTKVLSDATIASLLRIDGDTYYFATDASEIANLQPGDVMVSSVGEGFLRRVLSVTVGADELAVATAPANLEDAVNEASVVTSEDLVPSSSGPASAVSATSAIDNSLNVTFQGGATLSGTYSFHPHLDLGLDVGLLCHCLKSARAVLHLDQTAALDLAVHGGMSVSDEREIWNQPLSPIPVQVGPLTLIFVPELTINAGISVTADAAFDTSVSVSANLTAGIQYSQNSGWQGIGNVQPDTSYAPPHLTGSVEDKVYLSPEFSLKLYGVVGPYVSVEAFGRLTAQPTENPWWKLSVGVGAAAGFKVDVPVFGTIARYDAVVAEQEWVIAQADGPYQVASGEKLIFVDQSSQSSIFTPYGVLYWADIDGSNKEQLTDGQASFVGLRRTAAGAVLYYFNRVSDSEYQLRRMVIGSAQPSTLLDVVAPDKTDAPPVGSLSPDGNWVAFHDRGGVHVYSLTNGAETTILTSDLSGCGYGGGSCYGMFFPRWSADGAYILAARIFYEGGDEVVADPFGRPDQFTPVRSFGGTWSKEGSAICHPDGLYGGSVTLNISRAGDWSNNEIYRDHNGNLVGSCVWLSSSEVVSSLSPLGSTSSTIIDVNLAAGSVTFPVSGASGDLSAVAVTGEGKVVFNRFSAAYPYIWQPIIFDPGSNTLTPILSGGALAVAVVN